MANLTSYIGSAELEALIRDFDQWSSSKNVLNTFDGGLTAMGKVLQANVRAHVMATPSKRQTARRGRRSLRRSIASATQVSKKRNGDASTMTVEVNPRAMPEGEGGLPTLMEGLETWHHPVFGHSPIVYQSPHPYFAPAVAGAEKEAVAVGNHGIDTIADDLEG